MDQWAKLDEQLETWSPRLRDDLEVGNVESKKLATTIASEVGRLPEGAQNQIRASSVIPFKARIDELKAFQMFTDTVHRASDPHPAIVRTQLIVQNYICFVYLGDSLFKSLRKLLPAGSTTKKCCVFLTDNPVRAFRNAMAHGNWMYSVDFTGLVFWARKGSGTEEPMEQWEVSQLDLDFWQALARCVAYVAATTCVR